MPDYRRNRVSGGSYFFTVNLRVRGSDLLIANFEDCVKLGMYPPDWLGSAAEPADIGEPR